MPEATIQATKPAVSKRIAAGLRSMRPNLAVPALMLAIAIAGSLWLFVVIRDAVENVAQLAFERQASDTKHAIEARIHSYAEIMYGLQALLATSDSVSRRQFHRYVSSLDLKSRYPGYDVLNYAVHVTHVDKHQFEESVRRDASIEPQGYPNFKIRPPGDRAEYFVVVYVEPMAGFEFAFGLDLAANPAVSGSDPPALTALQHYARDTGALTASGRPIRIKARGREYTGLAIRLAVYRSGMPLASVDDRRAAYVGSVGAGFNVEELMKGVLDADSAQRIRFRVYDVGPSAENPTLDRLDRQFLLFDSDAPRAGKSAQMDNPKQQSHFTSNLPISFGGRNWEVHFSAPKQLVADRVDAFLPWLFLIGGLISSALLSGLFYSLASSRSRAVAIAEDITKDLRASENELRASAEQLQALSRRLVEVQESERKELSRELHDRVGQNLTALSIDLDIVRSQLPETVDAALRLRMDDATDLLASTTGAIENVMAELRPPMLDDYGLFPALEWYATEYSRRTGIAAQVQADVQPGRIPQAAEIALFRIMQEALNNVVKHAHATCVDIVLARTDTQLTMSINDDGKGYDARADAGALRRFGLGMATMRERTQAVGGTFAIDSAPGGGTRIVVRVPC